jgi:hypothetical protein
MPCSLGRPFERAQVVFAPRFQSTALAPAAAGIRRCFGRVRIRLIDAYQALIVERFTRPVAGRSAHVRRNAGAVETAIHRAVSQAERLIREGDSVGALRLLEELDEDLQQVRESGQIASLMEKWNARFPAESPVDLAESDLPQFQSYVEKLIHTAAADDPDDLAFLEYARGAASSAFEGYVRSHKYDSAEEAIVDWAESEDLESSFDVQIPASLQSLLGQKSLSITVRGLPTIYNVVHELETRYPPLRDSKWLLFIDDRPFVSSTQLLLPGQKLALVVPDPPAPDSPGGKTPMAALIPMFFLTASGFPLTGTAVFAGIIFSTFRRAFRLGAAQRTAHTLTAA